MARKSANAVNPADAENTVLNQTPPQGEEENVETPAENNGVGDTGGEPAVNPADADGKDEAASDSDESVPEFTKEQILKSNWYSHRRDVLTVLLEDGKTYSHAAVERLISNFMKGKVN